MKTGILRKARKTLLVLVAVYFCLLLLALGLVLFAHAGDRVVVFTNHRAIDPHGAVRETFAVDGKTVELWMARSPGAASREPQAFVLAFVGQGDRADRWAVETARAWGDKPVELWSMNWPGSGGSDGPPFFSRIGPAALASYDAVRKPAGGRPIFVQADSLGTTAALGVAARRPVAGLILRNPPPLPQLIMGRHGWHNLWVLAWPLSHRIPPEIDSVANAARVTAPAVFVLSESDEVVPPHYHQLVIDAYRGEKREIRTSGAGHNTPLTSAAQGQLLEDMDWLWAGAGLKPAAR